MASVLCGELQPTESRWLVLSGLQLVQVSGIAFVGCSMSQSSVVNATFVKRSFTNKSTKSQCYTDCHPGVLYYNNLTLLRVKQCKFANNRERNRGIYGSLSNLIVDQSTFRNNDGDVGVAIHHECGGGLYVLILNSNFSGNTSTGGTVWVPSTLGSVTIANNYFDDNVASDFSGAVYASAGKLVNITNCRFNDNTVTSGSNFGNGGALFVNSRGGGVNITDSYFSGNTIHSTSASSPGGDAIVVMIAIDGFTINNSYISNNVLSVVAGSSGLGLGGAVYVPSYSCQRMTVISNCYFIDNTVANNSA